MIGAECLARVGESKGAYNHLKNSGLDGTIILKWIFKKVWIRLIWRRIGPDGGIV
jgi:hypothetical protein